MKPLSVAVITPKLKLRTDPSEEDFITHDDDAALGDDGGEEKDQEEEEDTSEIRDEVAGLIQKLEGAEVRWTCAACDMEGRDETELRRHIEAAHVEKKSKPEFACGVCGKRFKQKKSLSNHMILRHVEDNYSDKPTVSEREGGELGVEWGEGASDIQRLPRGGFMCLKCGKVFGRRYVARQHLEIVHSTADPSLPRAPCHVCKKVCKNRPALIKHLHRTHNLGAKYARV